VKFLSASKVPKKVRVSIGSAITIGLLKGRLDAEPTTAYLMTYKRGKCNANCGFCPQARGSRSRADMLSRVSWPAFDTTIVLDRLVAASVEGKIKRVCIQALNYPKVIAHLRALIENILQRVKIPISVSCQPLHLEDIKLLKDAGAERIGIPIDAATEEIFDKVKGVSVGSRYNMKRQWSLLEEAIKVFGRGYVSTHFIVGLGETEKEMVYAIQKCVDIGVLPALFAFTPVSGTALENRDPPSIQEYRRVQVARYVIFKGLSRAELMSFDDRGRITSFGVDAETLRDIVNSGEPFLTSGCPHCNRPYYNEKPSGPIYNYPKPLRADDIIKAAEALGLYPKGYMVAGGLIFGC